jgi:sugar/nucleoside kinase (ribokinase family)
MTDIDLYAIGNALVDSEYEVSDAQLQALGVEKRHMTLIDAERRAALEGHVQDQHARLTGGGSAGNTVVAVAQLGGQSFYACRVADDALGRFYRDDLRANGVQSNLEDGLAATGQTGTCMVMITPDAERSMSTFLGATSELDDSALREAAIRKAKIYYMEGYLSAQGGGLAAALKGRAIARSAGVKLATTLSDVSMINFCRSGLEALIGDASSGTLDYLFCNEEEAQVWCGAQDIDTGRSPIGQRLRRPGGGAVRQPPDDGATAALAQAVRGQPSAGLKLFKGWRRWCWLGTRFCRLPLQCRSRQKPAICPRAAHAQ